MNLRAKNGVTALDMAMLINLNDTELFRMLANRSIESADLSKIAEEEQRHQLQKSESGFFRKISKSLKNKAWYKSVTDLNGTMVAKTETLPNKRERFTSFDSKLTYVSLIYVYFSASSRHSIRLSNDATICPI